MPDQVKVAWAEAEKLGIFKNFSVSSSGRTADPVLVGNTGGRHFFIANWLNFLGNTAVGFALKLRRTREGQRKEEESLVGRLDRRHHARG